MRNVQVGVMPRKEYQKYLLAVAAGTRQKEAEMPEIAFSSIESMLQLLVNNLKILKLIAQQGPNTITELAQLSGRKPSNLSRTLKSFEGVGLVRLEDSPTGRGKKPVVTVSGLNIKVPFTEPAFFQVVAIA
ncbi:MAG: MarR family transcriptional regulator [Pseudomonadales bacterium]|jgi:predicted transcriptional regulator|nr:MarR family transcriptional regulator [Pseudomonadales bacterium]